MSYVKCVNIKAYIQFQGEPLDETDTTGLASGKVYKAAPQTEDDLRLGELRVFDDTGEEYLFPAECIEPYLPNGDYGT